MVRWVAEIVETDGERFWTERKPVGTHKCSKEDKAKFYNPRHGQERIFEKLFESNEMFCLDSVDLGPFELYGTQDFQKHRRLDINYLPCELKQLTKANEDLVKKECLVDLNDTMAVQMKLKETKKYLKDPHITVITNN